MEYSNPEGRCETNAKSTDHTPNRYTQASTIDRGDNLPGNDTADNSPTELNDHVEETGDLRRPVSKPESTKNLSRYKAVQSAYFLL